MTVITFKNKRRVELSHLFFEDAPVTVTLLMDIQEKSIDAIVDGSRANIQITQDMLRKVQDRVTSMAPPGYAVAVYDQRDYNAA